MKTHQDNWGIPELKCIYNRNQKQRWASQVSFSGFPECNERFLYCQRTTPDSKWFGEAVVTRFLYYKEFTVWHEMFTLVGYDLGGRHGGQNRCEDNSKEIKRRLGSTVHNELLASVVAKKFPFAFKDPDIVAISPAERWVFLEVKVDGDRYQPFQLESLAILRDSVPDSYVAVVRLSAGDAEKIVLPGLIDQQLK